MLNLQYIVLVSSSLSVCSRHVQHETLLVPEAKSSYYMF